MELEQMKEQFKRVAAPVDVAARGPAAGDRSLDGLIETMKALDARDLALLRRSMVFFAVAAVFYLGLFVLTFIAPPDDRPGFHRAVLGLIGLALTGIGLRIRMMVRELSAVDYGEPVLQFLDKVEKRIRFVRREDLAFAIPFSLILAVAANAGIHVGSRALLPLAGPYGAAGDHGGDPGVGSGGRLGAPEETVAEEAAGPRGSKTPARSPQARG